MKERNQECGKEGRKKGRKERRKKIKHDEPESPNEGACLRYMMD